MATANYTLELPATGQADWHAAFTSLVGSLEVAVRSVQISAGSRETLVLSWTVATSLTITYAESYYTGPAGTTSAWTVLSAAPAGPAVGTFTLHAACPVLTEVDFTFAIASLGAGLGALGTAVAFLRGVIYPGSVLVGGTASRYAVVGQSRPFYYPNIDARIHGWGGNSLDAGTYGVTWEFRACVRSIALTGGGGYAPSDSRHVLRAGDRLWMTVTELASWTP